jgi:hypothetical protein
VVTQETSQLNLFNSYALSTSNVQILNVRITEKANHKHKTSENNLTFMLGWKRWPSTFSTIWVNIIRLSENWHEHHTVRQFIRSNEEMWMYAVYTTVWQVEIWNNSCSDQPCDYSRCMHTIGFLIQYWGRCRWNTQL